MSGAMEDKLQKMESLLLHSLSGIHTLFPNHAIRNALNHSRSGLNLMDPSVQQKAEELIKNLVDKDAYSEKIQFLNTLDPESYSLVVHVYLEIVEGALKSAHPHKNVH